ncbi:MAG TPA: hypothetical protein VIK18_04885 [Pirellulales bacterium]
MWLLLVAFLTAAAFVVKGGVLEKPMREAAGTLAFLSVFWIVGAAFLVASIHMGRRRLTLSVQDNRLSSEAFGGPLRIRRHSWQRNELASVRSDVVPNSSPSRYELRIMTSDGHRTGLLGDRDRAELEWLAKRVCFELGMPLPSPIRSADVVDPPPGCIAVLQPLDDGFTLSVPGAGVWKGSVGVFPFGIWFVFIMIVAVIVTACLQYNGMMPASAEALVVTWLLIGVNMVFAIAAATLGYHLGSRRAQIAVAGNRLLIVHRSVWDNWQREWERNQLAAIRAAEFDARCDNKQLLQLQIVPRHGPVIRLFSGREEPELVWIATLIRRALDLPAETASERQPASDQRQP